MNTPAARTDSALLRQYVERNSEEAFAALVSRHLSLVYTTCYRELRTAHLAEDAAQTVFILLAAKARTLGPRVHLAGWLFQTARFAARNARTRETRRMRHELEAAVSTAHARTAEARENSSWSEIEPLLTGAIARLSPLDREAVLLRYFDDLRLSEIGAALGVTEEAARKRVARALERLRRLLESRGAILGAGALAAMLPTYAASAAPPALSASIARFMANAAAGHVNAALVQPAVLELSKGITKSMRITQLKLLGAGAATICLGAAAFSIVHGSSDRHFKADLNAPIKSQVGSDFSAGSPPDAYRNVMVTGRVVYETGEPAASVAVAAQEQNKSMDFTQAHDPVTRVPGTQTYQGDATKAEQEQSWNNTITRPDGTYSLPVGNDVSYNIMVFDRTGKWVAAALEGVTGAKNATVKADDLVLTKGALIEGTVTTAAGLPVTGALGGEVMTYNPARPPSTAAVDEVKIDSFGHYRIRVAPGRCRVYTGNGQGSLDDKTITVAPGEVKTVNLISP